MELLHSELPWEGAELQMASVVNMMFFGVN